MVTCVHINASSWIICDETPYSLLLWFHPACCGRLFRCVTPTWADPAGTSSSSRRWGAPAAGTKGSHRAPGKFRAPLLLLQSARELSPTPHAKVKEQTENVADVELYRCPYSRHD